MPKDKAVRNRRPPGSQEGTAAKASVRRALEAFGYDVVIQPEPESAIWYLVAAPPNGVPELHVLQSQAFGAIEITTVTAVADEHKSALSKLGHSEYLEFKFGMLRDLILTGCDHRLADDDQGILTTFYVMTRIFPRRPDVEIIEAVGAVRRAATLAVIHIRRAAGADL